VKCKARLSARALVEVDAQRICDVIVCLYVVRQRRQGLSAGEETQFESYWFFDAQWHNESIFFVDLYHFPPISLFCALNSSTF